MIKIDAEIHVSCCPACGSFMLWLSGQLPEWKCPHVGFVFVEQWAGGPKTTTMVVLEEGIEVIRARMQPSSSASGVPK